MAEVFKRLGNYKILRKLGQGGFAEVYLGEHIYLKNLVAIKVLLTQVAESDAGGFLTEARTLVQLKHPHIVRVFEFGVEGETPYLVMEYAAQGTLRQRHQGGARPNMEEIVTYTQQIASALMYAHERKLVHRDLKPDNFLLQSDGHVLVSDFGLAVIARSSQQQSKQSFSGTAYYMAPEQIRGRPVPASDQYALGVVVYQWLSGNVPFVGTLIEVCTQHLFETPPPLSRYAPNISPTLEMVVQTALAKDPRERFASVGAFAEALKRALQIEPVYPAPLSVVYTPPLALVSTEEDVRRAQETLGGATRFWESKSQAGERAADPSVQDQELLPAYSSAASDATLRRQREPEASDMPGPYENRARLVERANAAPVEDLPTTPLPAFPMNGPEKRDPASVTIEPAPFSLPLPAPRRKNPVKRFTLLLLLLVLLLIGGWLLYNLATPGHALPGLGSAQVSGTSAGAGAGTLATSTPGRQSSPQTTPSARVSPGETPTPARSPTLSSTPEASPTIDATQMTPQQLYAAVMARQPFYSSAMSGPDSGQWNQNASCKYASGGYNATVALVGSSTQCYAEGLEMTDFAFQAQITFYQGNILKSASGLIFGAGSRFEIGMSGSYSLSGTSVSGTSSLLNTGLNHANVLTVIVQKNLVFLYANGQVLAQAGLVASQGLPGFVVESLLLTVGVTFTQVKIWTL